MESGFDDRVTGKLKAFASNAKIIHIDIDPAEISKNIKVDIPIVGDAKWILQKLLKYASPSQSEAWIKRIEHWKKDNPLYYVEPATGDGIKPQYIV